MNATIPESTVEEIFFDMNHEYPGVFNPLYILRNLTMLHDEVNYSMGSMQLQNGSSILIYALGEAMAVLLHCGHIVSNSYILVNPPINALK